MQHDARGRVKGILDEQDMLKVDLEKRRKELEVWSKELSKREALIEHEKEKVEEEKRKHDSLRALSETQAEEVGAQPSKQRRRKGKELVASTKFPNRAKRIPWTQAEELALVKAWINVSDDEVVGNAQKKGSFWGRVLDIFHEIMQKGEYRTQDQVNSKWKEVNAKVLKFRGIFNNVENSRQNGQSDVDVMRLALSRYREDNNGVAFRYDDTWELLRKSPKWQTIPLMDAPERPTKRSKATASNENTMSSDARCRFHLNDKTEEDDYDAPPIQEPQRPMVRNKARQAASGSTTSTTNEQLQFMIDEIKTFKTDNEKYKQYRKEKLELEKKKVELEAEERERKDFDFYISSHVHLDGARLAATLARKEKLRIKYKW